MKTFTEFKKHLQETKAGKEYKATDLDKQINKALEDAKNNSDNQEIVKLEAIRDEKDEEKKKARFDIYMNKKEEEDNDSSEDSDPDADDVQESAEEKADAESCSDLPASEKKKERQLDMKKMRNKK